jgi:hypothetical protein
MQEGAVMTVWLAALSIAAIFVVYVRYIVHRWRIRVYLTHEITRVMTTPEPRALISCEDYDSERNAEL